MILRFASTAALVVGLFGATGAQAQTQPPADPAAPVVTAPTGVDVARDIRHNGMSVGLNPGFFTPIGVYRDGTLIDIGIFGGDATRYFNSSPLVLEHLRDFRHQKIAGVVLWSTGFAALITDLALVCATASNRSVYHDNETLYWTLLGSGFVTNLVGAIMLNSANYSLQSAVTAHNAELLNQYLPAPERSNVGWR